MTTGDNISALVQFALGEGKRRTQEAAPSPQAPEPLGYDADPSELVEVARAEHARRTTPIDLAAAGYPDVTAADLAELQSYGASSRGVDIGMRHAPGVGGAFQLDSDLEHAEADIMWRAGKANREQQLLHLRDQLEGNRPQSGLAQFGQLAVDSLSVAGDIALGTATGGAGLAGAAGRFAAREGFKGASKKLLQRGAQVLGSSASTAAIRELPGRIIGEGGHSTANSLRRALPGILADDETLEALAEAGDRTVRDKLLDEVFDRHPLWKGLSESILSHGIETGGGLLLGALPPMQLFRALPYALLRRAGIKKPEEAFRFLRNTAGMHDGLTELAEEVLQGAGVEGVFGEGDLAERLASGVPNSLTEAAQIMLLGTLTPSVAAVVKNAFDMRAEARAKEQAAAAEGSPAAQGTGGRQGASTATGGDVKSGPGDATSETAGVDPGVSTAVPQEAVEDFAREARIENPQPVAPRNDDEAAAVQMARLLGRDVTLVSGRGGRGASGMIDAEGRMFVHAETSSPLGVFVHEAGHALADTLGREQFQRELDGLEQVAPGLVARYRDSWLRRNMANQMQSESEGRFAGEEARSAADPTQELATEEGFTSLAEEYAALISYASTTQGAKDMRVVAEYSPTIFRRMVDAVKRLVGRFKPESALGALDRIEKATRTRPDRAAAQLSLYLADLYKRGFGVDTRAAESGGTATVAPEGGGTLLEMLQREAEALGVEVVRPTPVEAQAAPSAPQAAPEGAAAAEPATEPQARAEAVPALPAGEQAQAGGVELAKPGETGRNSGETVEGSPAFDGARPDLNNPLATPETRAVLDAMDANRNEQGRPERRSIKEDREFAEEQLRQDYDGTRAEIETKLETGERLQTWETHALIQVMQGLAEAGLRGDAASMADAVRLGDAYRETRAEAARELGTVRGLGRPAVLEIIDMITLPSRANRRKLAKIRKEVDGMMRLVSPFKSSRARYLKTRHQMEQERRAKRFAPNREMRFAPGLLDEQGKPITEARLEALEAQKAKIEADEAKRMQRAGDAVRALGYDLDSMTLEDIAERDMWMIRNAISVSKATFTDKALEYRYMSLLSGIATQARNTAGNMTMLGVDGPILKVAEATANLAVKDPDSATYREVVEWFRGFAASIKPAFRNMLDAYRTQGPAFELELQEAGAEMGVYEHVFGSKLDFVPGPKIGGKLARGLRHLSLNTLLASDEFFKTIAATAEAHSLAFRQASNEGLTGDARSKRMQEMLDDKASPIWTQSLYKAREVTFQDDGGKISQGFYGVLNKMVGTMDDIGETYTKVPIGTLLIPFRKTPVRIAARALRLTPLQTAMLPARAIAGEYKGNKGALVRDLADAMMAWGLTLSILELLDLEDDEGRPFITGARADSSAEASLDYATAPPMSIRIGDTYYDYSRAEPFATGLGMLVALGDAYRDKGESAALQAMLQASVAQTKDKTFLRTIGDIMELADGSRTSEDRMLGFIRDTLVTPIVPNIVRQTARESDDTLRERRKLKDGTAAFWLDGIFPTATDDVAELVGSEKRGMRHDAWGRPIKKSYARKGFTDSIYRMLSPMQPKLGLDETTKIDLALLAWERKVSTGEVEDAKVYYPGRPGRTFKINGEDYHMPQSEFERYVRDSGQMAAERILADNGINFDDPSERDIERIRKHVNKARATVRNEIKRDVMALVRSAQASGAGR